MRASAIFCSLFVAGALSVPVKRDVVYDNEVVYVTEYITYQPHRHHRTTTPVAETITTTTPNPAPVPTSTTQPAPAPETTSTSTPSPAPVPTSTKQPAPAPKPTSTLKSEPAPEPSPTPTQRSSSSSGPTSDGVALIDTINKWRGKYNLQDLTWDNTLAGNALKTGTDDHGSDEKHELNPGSMAQVITPGMQKDYGDLGGCSAFELSYVAWLCEVKSDPQLNSDKDYCGLVDKILHMYYTDTGHHDILNSPTYSKIGCAFAKDPTKGDDTPYQGLWVCDLS